MLVKQIELFEVVLPRRRPHSWATTITQIGEGYVIVRITTDDGHIGYGEATVLPEWGGDFGCYYGESASTVFPVISSYLFSAIKDQSPFALEALIGQMNRVVKGHWYAKAAIEMALFDINGKALGQPVYNLLGGMVQDKITVAHSLGLMDIKPAIEEAEMAVSEGIRTIKVKGGLDPARDIALIRKLESIYKGKVDLVLDGNQSYRSVAEAVRVIKGIEDCTIQCVEQPVSGFRNLASIRSQVKVPIMADESAWSHYDVLNLARAEAVDYISIYVSKAGGLIGGKKVATVSEAAGMLCNVNGSAEFGVGNAANLHLAVTSTIISLSCVVPVTTIKDREQTEVAGRFYQDDIIAQPFRYDDGYLYVPTEPGLGIVVDEDKLKHYSVKDPLVLQ
ncbi:mandelate racemase/muconate lactonizing enzyme family protein [Chloroflexota bacterium]